MWQRIQTLWLLLAGILMTLLLLNPLAVFIQPDGTSYSLFVSGVQEIGTKKMVTPAWGLFVIDAIIVLISFITIFLYKKRILQIRLTVFNMLVTIGFIIYLALVSWHFCSTHSASFGFKFWLGIPLICLIFQYLAIRNIGADEALVRASNRLR
ncbi:DUF4293 domain-containing protein [Porphyromonas macacae]|uniref:DUF4293 domain-containing protein n=1 Tax=Porphyromonas macacae TaxID=28115 RepID=UPI00359FE5FC